MNSRPTGALCRQGLGGGPATSQMWRGVNTQILEKDINNAQTLGKMLSLSLCWGVLSLPTIQVAEGRCVRSVACKGRRHPFGHRG